MGYKRKKTFRLTWADGSDMDGFEIFVKSMSTERFLDLDEQRHRTYETPAQEREETRKVFREFAEVLVSWNLEDDDDTPIPCTYESFMAQDPAFVKSIMDAYGEHVAGVAPPLPQPSPGGEPSPEASIPMEPLSPSPLS